MSDLATDIMMAMSDLAQAKMNETGQLLKEVVVTFKSVRWTNYPDRPPSPVPIKVKLKWDSPKKEES